MFGSLNEVDDHSTRKAIQDHMSDFNMDPILGGDFDVFSIFLHTFETINKGFQLSSAEKATSSHLIRQCRFYFILPHLPQMSNFLQILYLYPTLLRMVIMMLNNRSRNSNSNSD